MGRLEVVMHLVIHLFPVIVIAYIFMGLVLQVVNPFMPDGNKRLPLLLPLGKKGLKPKQTGTLVQNIFVLATMIEIHFFMQQ